MSKAIEVHLDTIESQVASAANYTLNPKFSKFREDYFLRYIDLCYVYPVYHKIKTLPLI